MDVTGKKGVKVSLLQGMTEAYADLITGMTREQIGRMFARMEFALVKAGAVSEAQLCEEHGLAPWLGGPETPAPEPVPEPPSPVAPATAAAV